MFCFCVVFCLNMKIKQCGLSYWVFFVVELYFLCFTKAVNCIMIMMTVRNYIYIYKYKYIH